MGKKRKNDHASPLLTLSQNKRFETKQKMMKNSLIYFQRWNSSQNQYVVLFSSLFEKCVTKSCSIPCSSQVFILERARAHTHAHNIFPLLCVFVCALSTDLCYMPLRAWKVYTVQTDCYCFIITATTASASVASASFVFFSVIQLELSIPWLPHIYMECFHFDILQYFSFFPSFSALMLTR